MRTVLRNSSEVIHVWAQQNQPHARAANTSFDGVALRSYSTVIAKFHDSPRGDRGVLLTGRRYSVTTSGHVSDVRRGCYPTPVFSLPPGYEVEYSTTPADVREAWGKVITEACVNYAGTTRKPSRVKALRELTAAVDSANGLCLFYGLDLFPAVPEDAAVTAYVGERAAAEAERRAGARRAAEVRDAEHKELQRTALTLWQAGEQVYHNFYALREEVGDCLRLTSDGETVETTQGAYVPLTHIQTHAPLLLRMVRSGKAWQRNGHTIHLGHYQVDRIEEDGTLHAGCHKFKRAELERFAAVLGLTS